MVQFSSSEKYLTRWIVRTVSFVYKQWPSPAVANWQMCGHQYRRPGISQTTCLVSQYLSQWVNKKVSREFTQHIKCYTSNVLCILLILWKQPSFKQTSETVIAKCRITQLVPGSWASNSKCPMPTRAETVSRHNEVMKNEDVVDWPHH